MKNLPPNVYLHSYLQRAGVKFTPNVVDTIAKKGFGQSFYVLGILLVLMLFCLYTDHMGIFPSKTYFFVLLILISFYLINYIFRVTKYRRIKKKLCVNNPPIVVEAYAIVVFDTGFRSKFRKFSHNKSAVLYKECGSMQPRFFTGIVKNSIKHQYYKDQIAQVFIDRKNSKLYTVDDDKFYKTSSARKTQLIFGMNKVSASALDSIGDRNSEN